MFRRASFRLVISPDSKLQAVAFNGRTYLGYSIGRRCLSVITRVLALIERVTCIRITDRSILGWVDASEGALRAS